jgi:PAS domain S-box-containing protein
MVSSYIQKLKDKILEKTQLVFIISDPNQPDNPIIYANQGFTSLTGYSQEDVIGYNCRFLQGEGTDPHTVVKLREAIESFEPISVEILNYRKDGKPFWNLLHIDPIYLEEDGKYYFVGIQKDITDFKEAEEKIINYNREIELLSTPIVPIKQGVSVLPLIGNVDAERVDRIVERILPVLSKEEVETLILDLSGFSNMDKEATIGIFQLNDLLKLKGVKLIITGVTPKIAMRTQGLDIDFSSFIAYGSVKQAIEALEK